MHEKLNLFKIEPKIIPLKKAINIYKKEERTPQNKYNWYRKKAKNKESIEIGGIDIPTFKYKNEWHVNYYKFQKAINNHRKKIRKIKKVTKDYQNNILHGKDGEIITTEWGGYKINGFFHFAWSNYEIAKKRSNGNWYCNKCMNTAIKKDNCLYCPNCEQKQQL